MKLQLSFHGCTNFQVHPLSVVYLVSVFKYPLFKTKHFQADVNSAFMRGVGYMTQHIKSIQVNAKQFKGPSLSLHTNKSWFYSPANIKHYSISASQALYQYLQTFLYRDLTAVSDQ